MSISVHTEYIKVSNLLLKINRSPRGQNKAVNTVGEVKPFVAGDAFPLVTVTHTLHTWTSHTYSCASHTSFTHGPHTHVLTHFTHASHTHVLLCNPLADAGLVGPNALCLGPSSLLQPHPRKCGGSPGAPSSMSFPWVQAPHPP